MSVDEHLIDIDQEDRIRREGLVRPLVESLLASFFGGIGDRVNAAFYKVVSQGSPVGVVEVIHEEDHFHYGRLIRTSFLKGTVTIEGDGIQGTFQAKDLFNW